MKKCLFLWAVLLSGLLFPLAAALPVDESGSPSPIASPVGILSPTNQTYNTSWVTLNVTFASLVASNIKTTITYSLDGSPNQTLPLTTNCGEHSFQATVTGQTVLSGLDDGTHWVTVYESTYMGTEPPHTITDQDTALFTIATGDDSTANQAENTWTQKADLLTPRYNAGATAVNETIFVIGGSITQTDGSTSFSNYTTANEAYDAATDTWTQKAPLPMPRGGLAVAAYGGKVYCFGGATLVDGHAVAQNDVFVFDPASNSWENCSLMPEPASGIDANVVDSKIYIVGNLTMVYNPVADSWSTKTPIPVPVSSYASAVVDGKIYVIGGNIGGTQIVNLTQIYDPATDTWSQGAEVSMGVSSAAAAATTTPKAIYVLGGTTQDYPLNGRNFTQIYFPQNNTWSTGADMPKTKAGQSAIALGNVVYAFGGGHNIFTPDSTDTMQYVPYGSEETQTETQNPATPPSPSPSTTPEDTNQQTQKLNASPTPLTSAPQNPATQQEQANDQTSTQTIIICVILAAATAMSTIVVLLRRRRFIKKNPQNG
jgi:N-acetylneuraminic acid mutarotase